ncbi:MAG: rRNA maturation RNase YbeY [Pseudomonadales bacterium]
MNFSIEVQNEIGLASPAAEKLQQWAEHALVAANAADDSELTLRIVNAAEMSDLNLRFRNKAGTTNVLSFPAELPPGLDIPLLGDIAICTAVVETEARDQGKSLPAHWAHMVVHGILHLLDYDHIEEQDALIMEALETRILVDLNFPAPYTEQD